MNKACNQVDLVFKHQSLLYRGMRISGRGGNDRMRVGM